MKNIIILYTVGLKASLADNTEVNLVGYDDGSDPRLFFANITSGKWSSNHWMTFFRWWLQGSDELLSCEQVKH